MNVFGGEDRFWLGPEGGQYALYFKPDDPFDLDHWQVPDAFDWDTWRREPVVDRGALPEAHGVGELLAHVPRRSTSIARYAC